MIPESVSSRFRLAQKLLFAKQQVATAMTQEFFLRYPEWDVRYGERGRRRCTEDACFHVEFLAGAIEAGSPEAFADYSRWTARMLGARSIAAHTLEESLGQLERQLAAVLLPVERDAVAAFLTPGRDACVELQPALYAQPPADSLGLIKQVFLTAILGGQRQAALNIVTEAFRSGHSHIDLYVNVFTPALRRVGELWELNKISVAQEHIATSITQYCIAVIYPLLTAPAVHRGSMVVTGVSGELHQVGANLVADAMEASGWSVRFLGTNLPPASVLSVVEESSASVLCISTTIVANLPSVVELVQMVRDKLSERAPKILLGGAAYRLATRFAGEIGAVGAFTDLRPALAQLCA